MEDPIVQAAVKEHLADQNVASDFYDALVGVRYTVNGNGIVPLNSPETTCSRDSLPHLLRKWLHYVRSLHTGEKRTFEYTEYLDVQFDLTPIDNCIQLAVTKRHRDEIFGTYELELEQMAHEIVDATERYRNWLLDQQPELAAAEPIQELEELSDTVSDDVAGQLQR